MKRNHKHFGITLVEMLVALAILTIMMIIIHQLFNEITATVRNGTRAGEFIQKSRAMNNQLLIDSTLNGITNAPGPNDLASWTGHMVGPAGDDNAYDSSGSGYDPAMPGGFLVIINHKIDAPLTDDDVDEGKTHPIRSDQLMYFVNNGIAGNISYSPIAPSSSNTLIPEPYNSEVAQYARLWFGHAAKLPDVGSFNKDDHDLGVNSPTTINPNQVASSWVLSRQMLFLTGTDASATPPYPLGRALNNAPSGRVGIEPSTDVLEFDSSGTTSSIAYKLSDGITDIASIQLYDITGHSTDTSTPTYFQALGTKSGSAELYKQIVLGMSDPDRSFVFNHERLKTRVKPNFDALKLTPDELAPSHTFFMDGVSDFIVEWAGDLYSDSTDVSDPLPNNGIDFGTGETNTYAPDGMLDIDSDGRIMWYVHREFANYPGKTSPVPFDPNKPVTYPAPFPGSDSGNNTYKPYTTSGSIGEYATGAFVWQDYENTDFDTANPRNTSDAFEPWPWLIRIRYRLHDHRGEYVGREYYIDNNTEDRTRELGQWFQIIIPVNRQD